MPDEYWEYKLCLATGWTLEYVENMPVEKYDLMVRLMHADQNAGTLRSELSAFYTRK